jgi:hypothetical protein
MADTVAKSTVDGAGPANVAGAHDVKPLSPQKQSSTSTQSTESQTSKQTSDDATKRSRHRKRKVSKAKLQAKLDALRDKEARLGVGNAASDDDDSTSIAEIEAEIAAIRKRRREKIYKQLVEAEIMTAQSDAALAAAFIAQQQALLPFAPTFPAAPLPACTAPNYGPSVASSVFGNPRKHRSVGKVAKVAKDGKPRIPAAVAAVTAANERVDAETPKIPEQRSSSVTSFVTKLNYRPAATVVTAAAPPLQSNESQPKTDSDVRARTPPVTSGKTAGSGKRPVSPRQPSPRTWDAFAAANAAMQPPPRPFWPQQVPLYVPYGHPWMPAPTPKQMTTRGGIPLVFDSRASVRTRSQSPRQTLTPHQRQNAWFM